MAVALQRWFVFARCLRSFASVCATHVCDRLHRFAQLKRRPTQIDVLTTISLFKVDDKLANTVTIDLTMCCIAATNIGDRLHIECSVDKIGGSLLFLAARIRRVSDDLLVATGTHTKFRLKANL